MKPSIQDVQRAVDNLVRARILRQVGIRGGRPVYELSRFGRRLEDEHPELYQQLMNICRNPRAVQRFFTEHRQTLAQFWDQEDGPCAPMRVTSRPVFLN